MNKQTLKPGMRVCTAERLSAKDGDINVPASEIGKRLTGVYGTVVSPVAGHDREVWWIEHDTCEKSAALPGRHIRKLREEDVAIKEALARRDLKAPYKASELYPLPSIDY